jgi:hypothetical protein
MASIVYKANTPQPVFPHLQKIDAGRVLAQLSPKAKVYRVQSARCGVRGLENPAKDEAVDSLMSDNANSLTSVRSGNPLNGGNHSFGELSHRLAVWRSELHRFFPPQLLKFWKLFEHICDFESLPIAVINLSQVRFNLHFNAVVGSDCFCSLTGSKEGTGVNCCYANIL